MPKPLARYSTIDVRLFAPNLGAEIAGVAIEDGVSPEQFSEISSAFLDHQVLFFKDQKEISPERQIEFGRLFGELHTHPAAPSMTGYPEIFEIHVHKDSAVANGEFWHSDVSCDERPPLGSQRYGVLGQSMLHASSHLGLLADRTKGPASEHSRRATCFSGFQALGRISCIADDMRQQQILQEKRGQ